MLGVTNPFFRTTCAHWPNVLTVGERLEVGLPGLSKRLTGSPGGKGEAKEGFKTKRKRVVGKDKALLKRWEHAVGTPQASCASSCFGSRGYPCPLISQGLDMLLTTLPRCPLLLPPARELTDEVRFHFSHLTEKFLVPLNRYFGSLIPTDLSVSARRPSTGGFSDARSIPAAPPPPSRRPCSQLARRTESAAAAEALPRHLVHRLAQVARPSTHLPLRPSLGRSERGGSGPRLLRGLLTVKILWRLARRPVRGG